MEEHQDSRGDITLHSPGNQYLRKCHICGIDSVSMPRLIIQCRLNAYPDTRDPNSVAFLIWGFGLVWLVLAIASVLRLALREKIGFNIGWWGFVFPLGVFSAATTQLATELDSGAFRILGMIFSLSVVALWIYVSVMTLIKACNSVM